MMEQLPLDLAHRPAHGRADFIAAPANREALAWVEAWPDWPGTALALAGPEGSGKTHLAAIWQRRSDAIELSPASLAEADPDRLIGAAQAVLIDGADRAPERPLLHLYNVLGERRGHLLIVAREPPARWNIALPDLRSRLVASPAATLAAPDQELLGAVLVKLFADRQLKVSRELVEHLVTRLERSFAAIENAVNRLDRAALAERRAVTVPLARRVLGLRDDANPV
jgi:chromosomal replication initiation ATPase DnaA